MSGVLDLFRDRLAEVGAKLHVCRSDREGLERIQELAGRHTWAAWSDPLLDPLELAGPRSDPRTAELSLIRADVGVAQTGTIGFAHGTGRPRAAALMPESQIAVLEAGALVETVGEALARFFGGAGPAAIPSSVVLVTGPSRTADIELRPIVGVHSPKHLDVVLIGAERANPPGDR